MVLKICETKNNVWKRCEISIQDSIDNYIETTKIKPNFASLNKISIKKPINSESDVTFNVEPLQVVGKNEQTIEGLRTSIIIDNANCPKEYKFTFELEDGDRFVTAK